MRKRIRFIKKYFDEKRAYNIGQIGEFEGDFLKMLLKKKYAVEVDGNGDEIIKIKKVEENGK